MNTIAYVYKLISSPYGQLKLVASDKGLAAVLWENDDPRRVRLGPLKPAPDNKFLKEAEKQLKAYFDGRLKKFTVPLDFKGTDFQKSVWAALLTIPFGETRSYGEIARQIGRPEASREDVEAAARLARIDGLVASLPQGYDTVIGEGGATLSEGEKQRLLGIESGELAL